MVMTLLAKQREPKGYGGSNPPESAKLRVGKQMGDCTALEMRRGINSALEGSTPSRPAKQ